MAAILVVDDDTNIRVVLKYRFEKESYTVQLARNGSEAVEKLSLRQPDLIILDLLMPEMDGIQFLEHLRADPRTRDVPVVVLTALGRGPHQEEAQRLGVEAWFVKPFSPRQLVEHVRRALSNGCNAGGGE